MIKKQPMEHKIKYPIRIYIFYAQEGSFFNEYDWVWIFDIE